MYIPPRLRSLLYFTSSPSLFRSELILCRGSTVAGYAVAIHVITSSTAALYTPPISPLPATLSQSAVSPSYSSILTCPLYNRAPEPCCFFRPDETIFLTPTQQNLFRRLFSLLLTTSKTASFSNVQPTLISYNKKPRRVAVHEVICQDCTAFKNTGKSISMLNESVSLILLQRSLL